VKPIPWSHSSLSDFLNCPKAYYHKRIAKDVLDPPNDAGRAGDYTHKAFEAYLTKGTPLPTTYPEDIREWPQGIRPPAAYEEYLDALKEGSGELRVECKYAITKDFKPCGFFDDGVWCRGILDILHINGDRARVLDHKTGKRKSDGWQLKLAALLVFAHHPEVMTVKAGYMWLKDSALDTTEYLREQEGFLWQEFLPRLIQYKTAFEAEVFVPRPSGLCNGWCPVKDCEFWKPKRSK
jgi:RecB family exonuclease